MAWRGVVVVSDGARCRIYLICAYIENIAWAPAASAYNIFCAGGLFAAASNMAKLSRGGLMGWRARLVRRSSTRADLPAPWVSTVRTAYIHYIVRHCNGFAYATRTSNEHIRALLPLAVTWHILPRQRFIPGVCGQAALVCGAGTTHTGKRRTGMAWQTASLRACAWRCIPIHLVRK